MKRKTVFHFFAVIGISGLLTFAFNNCGRSGFVAMSPGSSVDLASQLGDPPILEGATFTCSDPNAVAASPIRRLSKEQIRNTLQVVLGAGTYAKIESLLIALGDDDPTGNLNSGKVFQAEDIKAIFNIGMAVGEVVYSDATLRRQLVGTCADAINDACATSFITNFGKKALRRPITAAESAKYLQDYKNAGGGALGLRRIAAAIMQAPEVFYHVEVGTTPGQADAQFALTSYEVANRLAYLVTDSPPDTQLVTAADQNQLSTRQLMEAHVDRLLNSTAGKNKFHRFFSLWLGVGQEVTVSQQLATSVNINTTGLGKEMAREWYEFIDHITYQKKGTYKELLTSKRSFARTPALAQIYQHSLAADPVTTEQVFGDERMGLLLRAPHLASADGNSHPFIRAALIRKKVLCESIGMPPAVLTPPPGTNPDDPQYILTHSTRERLALKTSTTNCQACHALLNPVGFGFENFDGLGRTRTQELRFDDTGKVVNMFPVNAQVTDTRLENAPMTMNGGAQIIQSIADGTKGPACFVRQTHRFYQLRLETKEDNCLLGNAYALSASNGTGLYGALKAVILNNATNIRRTQ